nr:immunoglobulin heavy chain junction region [Macaca mulatta]
CARVRTTIGGYFDYW